MEWVRMLEGLIENWEELAGVLLVLAGTVCEMWLLRNVFWARHRAAQCLSLEPPHARDVLPRDREDCDFGLLWETQKEILESLYLAGNEGLSVADLTERYNAFALRYPELCEGIPFLDWLRWMRETRLVACEDDRTAITEEGRFLLYDLDRNHAFADHRCV